MTNFSKWMSIPNFQNMYFGINRSREYFGETEDNEHLVSYNAKIKLHGTNAAINIEKKRILAQKRTGFATLTEDNAGFASWVYGTFEPWVEESVDNPAIREFLANFIFHGEWCGPGVQKGVACSMTEKKFFAVFAIETKEDLENEIEHAVAYDPKTISLTLGMINNGKSHDQIKVIPWFYKKKKIINLYDREAVNGFIEETNKDVEDIGKLDPWMKSEFGVEGTGEGLVFYQAGMSSDKKYIFKAKSEDHRVTKTKEAAHLTPEIMGERDQFAATLVTDVRLEQGYAAMIETFPSGLTHKNVPDFLRWIANDVTSECVAEIETNGYTWKEIAKPINLRAVQWFTKKINTI